MSFGAIDRNKLPLVDRLKIMDAKGHNLHPERDIVFGFVSWWCDDCKRFFLGEDDHNKYILTKV